MVHFYKLEAWGQTVLPDRSTLNCKKLGENEKKNIKNSSETFLGDFDLKLAVKQCYQTGQFQLKKIVETAKIEINNWKKSEKIEKKKWNLKFK